MKQDKRITIRLTPGLMDVLEVQAHKMNVRAAEYARQVLKKAVLEEGKVNPETVLQIDTDTIKAAFKEAIKECLEEHNYSDRRKVETSANVETFVLLRKFLEKQDSAIVTEGHEKAKEFLEQVGVVS